MPSIHTDPFETLPSLLVHLFIYIYRYVFIYIFFNKNQNERIRSDCIFVTQRHCLPPPQTSVVVFRELCGVPAVANLMQCVRGLASCVAGPDGSPLLLFDLRDDYPALEPQGPLPDVLRKVVSAFEMVTVSLYLPSPPSPPAPHP